jgi:DNA polymerase
VHHFGTIPLVVTYHPAYLLRSPGEKRKAWEDLKFARGIYQQLGQEAGNGLRA